MAVASSALAIVVGTAFAVLLVSIADLRETAQIARHSEEVLAAANQLERLVVDIETGQRGFVITGDKRFLEPWNRGRVTFPPRARSLERLVADNPEQEARARRMRLEGTSYIREYSIPLVNAVRRGDASARGTEVTAEGKRLVDALRAVFEGFIDAERRVSATRDDRSDTAARRAIVAAATGVAGSIFLILLFTGYLTRVIVRPIRRAALMADQLAGGDLRTRMPESGVGEIGALERSFNAMAGSLEASQEELAASRARIVAAADETRRHIERDLHDGTQQRLVSLGLELRLAQLNVPPGLSELDAEIGRVADELDGAVDDLREISRGIHPAILSEGGLVPALRTLARRSTIPVELDVQAEARLPEHVEVAAYYVASEALTNTAKHARASRVRVAVEQRDGTLQLSIGDDGIGGADPVRGSGLVGLRDRVEALGGSIEVSSAPGEGTLVVARLPVQPG
jgi:signal transduction histidine kinase